jgi:hypothetical protein
VATGWVFRLRKKVDGLECCAPRTVKSELREKGLLPLDKMHQPTTIPPPTHRSPDGPPACLWRCPPGPPRSPCTPEPRGHGGSCLLGSGQQILKDPVSFFDITYPTEEIVQTLRALCQRASRPEEVPGTILFGGKYGLGKSHVLLAAHHALSAPQVVAAWAVRWNLDPFLLPERAVVLTRSFIQDGTEPIWDMLFTGLGRPQQLTDFQAFPDGRLIESLLGDRPVFLIMDELERWYDAQDVHQRSRARNYLQALSEVAARNPRLTLLTSVLGETAEPAGTLRRVKPLELSFRSSQDRQRVVLFRLFSDREAHSGYIAQLCALYQGAWTAAGLPESDQNAERLSQTWPFTPELLDLFTKKIPEIGGFQTTRGTLRFLAAVVRATLHHRPILSSGDIPIQDRDIQRALSGIDTSGGEVVRRALGDNYDAVPAALPFKDGLFSTLLLYSVADPTHPGARVEDILRALLEPGQNPNHIRDALAQLKQLAYNLHEQGDRYLFRAAENPHARINAVAASSLVSRSAGQAILLEIAAQKWGAPELTALYQHPDRENLRQRLKELGRQRPHIVLSTAALSPAVRLEIQNLDERRNLLLLVEPRIRITTEGAPYHLLGDESLLRRAIRIQACSLLLEGRPEPTSARIYEQVRLEERQRLGRELAERYGTYINWNRAGATGTAVDDTWYEVASLEDFSAQAFLGMMRRDYTSAGDVQDSVKRLWRDFLHRKASQLIDHFDCTPGLPIPLDAQHVPLAIRSLAREGILGLADSRGQIHCGPTIERLPIDELPACSLVEPPPKVVEAPPPPPADLPAHSFVSAQYDVVQKAVTLHWMAPQGNIRTLVQRYTHAKGWQQGRSYPLDLDQTHEANRYLGSDASFVDREGLIPGTSYHYYVFLVVEQPGDRPHTILSQRCDVQVPVVEAGKSPDRLDIPPQANRNRLVTEAERLMMMPKNMGPESRVRKLEVRIGQVEESRLSEWFAAGLRSKVPSVEVSGDIRMVLRGEFDRQTVLGLLRQLPQVEGALYSASLLLRSDTRA